MDSVDLIGIGSYTELPGGNIELPLGYSTLLSPILKTIPEKNILKNTPVKTIHWMYRSEMSDSNGGYDSDGGASDCSVKTVKSIKNDLEIVESTDTTAASSLISSVTSSVCPSPTRGKMPKNPNVKIECDNDVTFYADHVINTIPLGVLQQSPDLFSPTLPPDKRTALTKLHFGTVNKIYLEFERPFLSPDISEIILLWSAVVDEAKLPLKDKWFRKIYSFCKVSETLLVGWISGEEAQYMETLKLNVIAETCTNLLKKFLADPYIPKPKSCIL